MKKKIKDLFWLIGMGIPLRELRRLVENEMERQRRNEMFEITRSDIEKMHGIIK